MHVPFSMEQSAHAKALITMIGLCKEYDVLDIELVKAPPRLLDALTAQERINIFMQIAETAAGTSARSEIEMK